ncbi:alpha/beta hydrolase [Actinophytocola xinjiangensis]|uniref:Alpha/beta hydrolase n=1 Tax=Actinophytocola xinjiangensis TaxID=485602 RepID=A0A7Z0WHW4_9PSEU|nr:alpha/beta family hydrolase [Actinophytocola xinjiangensis]OLF06554.1 alpha/beta hydrolase [Actinophytocola xinjiangensis]
MTAMEIDTPHGPARAQLHCAEQGRAGLLLGHGAGGGVGAPDLVAATRGAQAAGVHVALVEQPYRVAGRRAPAPAGQLDTAWLAVAEVLSREWFDDLPLVFGGRSSGARVACRTAADGQAVAVLCLAFPVHPPGKPDRTRMPELDAVTVPTLVVQGRSDPFGMPDQGHHREIVVFPGDHSLRRDADGIGRTVEEWLGRILRPLD